MQIKVDAHAKFAKECYVLTIVIMNKGSNEGIQLFVGRNCACVRPFQLNAAARD